MAAGRFTKKPLEIEAIQYTLETRDEIIRDFEGQITHSGISEEGAEYELENLRIETLEGVMTASLGDYIIRGIQGEVYPCKPDIFEASYEATCAAELPSYPELMEILEGVVDCAIWQSGATTYPVDSAWPEMQAKMLRGINVVKDTIESEGEIVGYRL